MNNKQENYPSWKKTKVVAVRVPIENAEEVKTAIKKAVGEICKPVETVQKTTVAESAQVTA